MWRHYPCNSYSKKLCLIMIFHVDANSFYASCEQIYRPDLRNKPVIVLSNNDGILIAVNKEAKLLGLNKLKKEFLNKFFG